MSAFESYNNLMIELKRKIENLPSLSHFEEEGKVMLSVKKMMEGGFAFVQPLMAQSQQLIDVSLSAGRIKTLSADVFLRLQTALQPINTRCLPCISE